MPINRNIPFLIEVAKGNIEGHTFIHKFGEAEDIDALDGFADIWDGVGNANADKVYTFSTSADIDSISSSNNGDTQDIEIHGLDANYAEVIQTITLTGQTRKALDTALIRVNKMINVGSTDIAGAVYCYVNGTLDAGVPETSADIRAIINNGNNQTLMAIYTVPAGKTVYFLKYYVSMSKLVASAVANVRIFVKPFGQVFQLKETLSINTPGDPAFQYEYPVPRIITEKSDIIIKADASVNDVGVSAAFCLLITDN